MSRPLFVIPCSRAKLDRPAPAGELYVGSWHKLARQAADVLAARYDGRVLILSALHGALQLDELVAPYDLMMGEAGSITREQLAGQLRQLDGPLVTLLPSAYRLAVEAAAGDRYVSDLVAGCPGVGYQRQRLAELRDGQLPAQLWDLAGWRPLAYW